MQRLDLVTAQPLLSASDFLSPSAIAFSIRLQRHPKALGFWLSTRKRPGRVSRHLGRLAPDTQTRLKPPRAHTSTRQRSRDLDIALRTPWHSLSPL
jgi:uncharacterized membrane-anchored protein YjiN (DUF445 family)